RLAHAERRRKRALVTPADGLVHGHGGSGRRFAGTGRIDTLLPDVPTATVRLSVGWQPNRKDRIASPLTKRIFPRGSTARPEGLVTGSVVRTVAVVVSITSTAPESPEHPSGLGEQTLTYSSAPLGCTATALTSYVGAGVTRPISVKVAVSTITISAMPSMNAD